jgi:molecular chaperone GrpE
MIDEQKQPETTSQTPETNTEQDSVVATEEDLTPTTATETPSEEILENSEPQSSELDSDLEDTSDLLAENEEIFAAFQRENANLKQLLDEKSQQLDISKAQYARLAADFDNFRRRTAQEKANLEQQAKKNVIVELLPVIDNFERARTQLKPETEGEKEIHNSYQGVYKTLVDCLKRMGVSAMRPEGEQFDPNFHEAMLREPTNEHPEGTVLEQLMRGYVLGDLILRHAMVKVAVPIEPVITSEEEMTRELETENIES